MPKSRIAIPTEMAITCSSTPRSVVDVRSPRMERFQVACSRRSCSRPVTRMWIRLMTPRNFPMTTAVTAMPTRTRRYGPRLGWLELVMREAIHSQTTGETSHMVIEPAAMTSTSAKPAAWRCGPTDLRVDGPACVLIAPPAPLYPISGPPRAGHAGRGGEAAGAVLRGARGLGRRTARAAAVTGARHPRHAPGQRGDEDDRQREDDEAGSRPQPAGDV